MVTDISDINYDRIQCLLSDISSTVSRHWEKSETQRGIVKSPLFHPTSPVTSTTCLINKQIYNMILSIRGMRDNTYEENAIRKVVW